MPNQTPKPIVDPEKGEPSIGLLLAVGVVAGLVVGTVTAIASLSTGFGVVLGTIVGVLSMVVASERLSLLPFKRGSRRR